MRYFQALGMMAIASLAASGPIANAKQSGPSIIPLYPAGVLPAPSYPELRSRLKDGQLLIRNVTVPTMEMIRPAAGTANGAAVIVAPGGGFVGIGYDREGTDVARRLAAAGVTAFVLKYRTIRSGPDPEVLPPEHLKEMELVMGRMTSGKPAQLPLFAGEPNAIQDGMQAIRLVREGAARFGIDPARVGIVGFSAGAFLAVDLAIGDKATRPNFVGLIYGTLRAPIPADAPPAFIAGAADDEMLPSDPVQLYTAWKAAGLPAELHIYERGGHGFGARRQGATSDHWLDEFLWWMRSRGLMTARTLAR